MEISNFNLRKIALYWSYELAHDYAQKKSQKLLFRFLSKILGESVVNQLLAKNAFRVIYPVACQKILESGQLQGLGQFLNSKQKENLHSLKVTMEDINSGSVKKLIKVSLILFYDLRSFFFLFKLKGLKEGKNLGLEIAEGLDPTFMRSELNWYNSSQIPTNKLCLYFRHQSPKELNDTESIINYSSRGATILTTCKNMARLVRGQYLPTPLTFNFVVPLNPLYDLYRTTSWLLSYFFWLSLFKKFGIRAWFFINEEEYSNIIQRSAMEKLHGVTVTRHRSNLGEAWGLAYQPAHIVLVWSAPASIHFNLRHNNIECPVVAGHPFVQEDLLESWKKRAEAIRHNFASINPQTFVIGIFDNIFGPINEVGSKELEKFYDQLFSFVERNDRSALLLKSKKEPKFPSIMIRDKFNALLKSQKAIVISGNYLPSIIAFACDVVIGQGPSSPAMEAFILGRRGLIFWPAPDPTHALTQLPEVVKIHVETIMSALEDMYRDLKNTREGFVPENTIKEIDPYCDGKGPWRLGKVLALCVDSDWKERRDLYKKINESNLTVCK